MRSLRSKIWLCSIAVFMAGCTTTLNQNISEPNAPEETQPPHTDYQPAFSGQTRVPGMTTSTHYSVRVISDQLNHPWGMAVLPNGNFLITEKEGQMKIVDTSGAIVSTVTGFPPVLDQGQGGMLDVAIDPNFNQNRMIYWTFSGVVQDGSVTEVAKGRLSNDGHSVENPTVIFKALPAYSGDAQYGSRLVFGPNGYLFVSTGDRFDPSIRGQAQDLNSSLGKVLKMTKGGQHAPGNPFTNDTSDVGQIFTYGHRNPEGLAFNPISHQLWSSEMGPMGGDELNLIQKGNNYGWPIISYGLEYNGQPVGAGITQKAGMTQPVYYWDPSVSPSGMTFYKGEIIEWDNNLFIACLGGEKIIRLSINNDKVVGEEWLLTNMGERFRDVCEGKDGRLYAITDSGKMIKIQQKKD